MASRVAIVTGAASGIGLELTRNLVKDSWKVVMADLNTSEGERLSKELGQNTAFYRTDVSSWEDQAALFKFAKLKFGRIDFVAANAGKDDRGFDLYAKSEGEPVKPNLKTIEVDLISVLYGLWLAVHYFRQNGADGGKIVITSSSAGLYGFPTNPQYAAAKHGIVGLVRSTAPVFKRERITVNCICPAFVPTGLAPAKLLKMWPEEHITPIATIMKAFKSFLDDDELTGQVVECSKDEFVHRPEPPFINESQRWVFEESSSVWSSGYEKL